MGQNLKFFRWVDRRWQSRVSASLHDLQRMIDICCREAVQLDMAFNANKSQAIRVGRVYGKEINPITVNCVAIRI